MTRDILNVAFGPGVKVRLRHLPKMGIGTMTGDSHLAGTAQVRRWAVEFPHSRTKSKKVTLACEAHEIEIIPQENV